MSAMEDKIRVIVHDASVVTVPLVDNLTASNAAPKASTVGAAIAQKADADRVMEYVTITFNDIESDQQGLILATGEDIPADSSQNAPTVAQRLEEIDEKTAEDILYEAGGSATVKAAVEAAVAGINNKIDTTLAVTGGIAEAAATGTAISAAVETARAGVALSVEGIAADATTHDVSLAGLMATTAEVQTAIDEVLAGQ